MKTNQEKSKKIVKADKAKTGKATQKKAAAKITQKKPAAKTVKNTVKKSVQKTGVKDTEWESLAVELRSLIPRLDSEGLAFLVEQARVHLYNMQVDELNQATIAAEIADAGSAEKTRQDLSAGKAGHERGKAKSEGGTFKISGTESGSSYYLHYRNNELMFSRDEMIRIVKIVNAEGTDLEIRERLFNWFDRERKDAFAVIPMADKFDNHLKIFAAFIRNSFKIRG